MFFRKRVLIPVVGIAFLGLAGIFLLSSDVYRDWQDRQHFLDSCKGGMARQEAAEFLESDKVYIPSEDSPGRFGFDYSCQVAARDNQPGAIEVRIGRAERVSIFHEYTSGRRMFAPLGGGWSGFVATDAKLRESEIMILLPCANQDELLVAQVVGAVQDSERMITAENAGSLARMGVEALRAESAASGCGETESGQVASPTLPPTQFVPEAEGMAPEDAEGTCAPLALDPSIADGLRVSSLQETPADISPLESCVFITDGAEEQYWLSAWYGPYAEEAARSVVTWQLADAPSGTAAEDNWATRAWGTAQCPDGIATARYALVAGTEDAADRTYTEEERAAQRALLVAFAMESAERHGCDTLDLPSDIP